VTMNEIVVRRFEVHEDRPNALAEGHEYRLSALDKVARALGEAAQVTAEVKRTERPPKLLVRLRGAAPAVSKLRELVANVRGVRILRDFLDVPAAAPAADKARGAEHRADIYPDLRALLRIDPERGSRRGGPLGEVVVAIIDSGIMIDHENLERQLWKGDVEGKPACGARCIGGVRTTDVTDRDGHGTMIAGTILATAAEASNVKIMAVKFWDVDILPVAANAADAINFAVERRAHIINLSWDLGIGSTALEHAIQNACETEDGPLIVIAAGNAGTNNDKYPSIPARYARECPNRIITVMATDWYDEKAWFSNYGRRSVDLAAPGAEIESTRPFLRNAGVGSQKYRRYTGTSPAAAHVSGAAALLKARNPGRTAEDLKRCLVESVDREGLYPDAPRNRLKCRSGGRLNLTRALAWP
jgi:subtilisin family serine protease